MKITLATLTMLATLALTGCGSDDGQTGVSGNITGVAATGNAISGGIVTLKCAGGLNTATATTATDGSYRFTVKNITLPCLSEVSFTDSNSNAQTLHSYVSAIGTSNITPLTDLLLAALFLAQPDDVFSTGNFKTFTSAERAAALAAVQTSLQAYGINLPADLDPIRDSLIAKTSTQNGNEHDLILNIVDLQMTLVGNPQINLNIPVNGGLHIINLGAGLFSNELINGSLGVSYFFSNPPKIGDVYVITRPDPSMTLASYMAAHALAGTYNGTFTNNGGNCSFTVNTDASVSSGFILPVTEGSNAATSYLIPESAFMAASGQPATSWVFQDTETQRAGGLSIVNESDGSQSLSLTLLDSNVSDGEICRAPLTNI
ncbi:MAG: hypothetical protein REI12_03145 [Pedobacter sp.]|nr:hypothetical protein [Pedobacter sp.]